MIQLITYARYTQIIIPGLYFSVLLVIKSSQQMYQEDRNYFAEELEQIHQIYIKTSYGNIFAHAVGKHGQPLIIVVHGSGPRNSGDQYLYLLHEYLVRVSYIQKFFIISIDCPGYGRSKGSKQAVKTFPLQMFRQILKDLRYDSYFAMLGHSQGGAAIFNAIYQDPKLSQFLLMDRPVCGNIKRFSKFPIPTLLVYDIQDDGHPIWQGKLLYKQLQSSQLYTYRNSHNPFWVPDNIWNLIIGFFRKYSTQRKSLMSSNFSRGLLVHRHKPNSEKKIKQHSVQKSKSKQKKKHVSTSKCQQIKKQREKSQKDLVQIKQIDKSQIYSKVSDLQQFEDLPVWLNQPKIQQTEEEVKKQLEMKKKQEKKLFNQVKIQHVSSQPQEKLYNKLIQEKKLVEKMEQKKQQNKQKGIQIKNQGQYLKNQSNKQNKNEEKQKQKSQEDENKCSICHQIYYYATETNCKHIFCKKCIGESYLVDRRCPLCRTQVSKRIFKEDLHARILQSLSEKQRQKRQKQLNKFEQLLKSIVYIQIGNTSRELETKKSAFTKTKTKYLWQIYAKQPKNFKFQYVSFNINMGNPDSVPVRVAHAPFVFESRSTFSFSCQITIKPKNKDYAPIVSVYRIDVSPGNHSKVIALKKKKN